MRVEQLSVFVENQAGRLVAILEALKQKEISIRALSISETAEFGIVRMILSDPEAGHEALRQAGFTCRTDWIVSAEIPDVPGGLLDSVAKPLAEAGVKIIIHANHLLRSAYPAMIDTAESILRHERSYEAAKKNCISIKDILILFSDNEYQ